MQRVFYAMLGVGFCCMALMTSPVAAQTARDDVAFQLQVLQRWLGAGPVADGWHSFLRTDDLQRELARGAEADPGIVAGIAARYAAATPGLERSQFANVRHALERWYRELNRARGPQSLSQLVLSAKEAYVPPTRERLGAARRRLDTALQRLDQFLSRNPEKREGWRAYLGWDVLQAELTKNERPNAAVLYGLSSNFYQNHVGLELAPFGEARRALRDYADAVFAVSEENPRQAYEQRIDELAQRLDTYTKEPTDAESVAIGNLLDYLSGTHQAPLVVESIRSQFSQPNLYGSVSQSLMSAAVARNVNEINPVREVILGTDIYGTAHTVGRVSLRTIPSQQNALVELIMNGHASSRNIGYNGPATICSIGSTTLCATKRVVINDQGLASYPAVAVASTDTTITDIQARRRLVERIAWKRAYRSESEAEAIASRRAEARLQRRFDAQSAEALAEAQDNFYNRFRLPMRRRDIDPQLHFSSTHSDVALTALQMGRNRLGAPTPPPPPGPLHDLNVRVHESMVGNAAEVILAGRTLTDERLAELVKETTGEVPEELQITEDKDPWSITFSQDRPFSVIFDGQTVTMAIHARQFTRGDRVVGKPLLISARYKAEQQGLGARLVRDGEVVVEYVNQRGRQSVQEVAYRAFMRRKFEALFKEEIVSEGLKPKGRLASVGTLALQRLEIDNGWMALSWDQASRVPYRPNLTTSVAASEN